MKRNSNSGMEIRELPEGARQSERSCELALELPAEGIGCIMNEQMILGRLGRIARRKREKA